MFGRALVLIVTFTLPVLVLAQTDTSGPNAGITQPGATAQPPPPPVSPDAPGPAHDMKVARKAIMDRMRECMKGASTKEAKKVCRDEMRKSRMEIHEAKRANKPKKK